MSSRYESKKGKMEERETVEARGLKAMRPIPAEANTKVDRQKRKEELVMNLDVNLNTNR